MSLRLRLLLEPRYGASYDEILALAKATEDSGFDAFFRSDHFLGIEATDTTLRPTDSWTTLGGLARETTQVRLGTLMTASTFRQPAQLAIAVATADAMSGGRIELGIGAGWFEREHRSFGIPFPTTGGRFDRLEEQLAIITGLWDTPLGKTFSFDGRHYQLEECANFPVFASRPHPPIIIGGGGPRRTPTLAARFADEFNSGMPRAVPELFANFRRICEEVGRDPATVRLSACLPTCVGATAEEAERNREALGSAGARLLGLGVTGTPAEVAAAVRKLEDDGADTVYFHFFATDPDQVRLLGEVVRAFA
jgi:F420-dependent oxidoreductase-like protein